MIAEALGFDKVEFRRKNLLREGRPQASGTLMRDAALDHGKRGEQLALEQGAAAAVIGERGEADDGFGQQLRAS